MRRGRPTEELWGNALYVGYNYFQTSPRFAFPAHVTLFVMSNDTPTTPHPVRRVFNDWLNRFFDLEPGLGPLALLTLRIAQLNLRGPLSLGDQNLRAKLASDLQQFLTSRGSKKGLVCAPEVWGPGKNAAVKPLRSTDIRGNLTSMSVGADVGFDVLVRRAAGVLLEATSFTDAVAPAPQFVLACSMTLLVAACMQTVSNEEGVLANTSQLADLAARAAMALDTLPGEPSRAASVAAVNLRVTSHVHVAVLLHGWRALTEVLPQSGAVAGLIHLVDVTWHRVGRTDPRKRPFLTVVAALRTVATWSSVVPGHEDVLDGMRRAVAQVLLQAHAEPGAEESQCAVTSVVLSALGLPWCLGAWMDAAPGADPRAALWLGVRLLGWVFLQIGRDTPVGYAVRDTLLTMAGQVAPTMTALLIRQRDPRAVALADAVVAKVLVKLPCDTQTRCMALKEVLPALKKLDARRCLDLAATLQCDSPTSVVNVPPDPDTYVRNLEDVDVVGSVAPTDALFVGGHVPKDRSLKRLRAS